MPGGETFISRKYFRDRTLSFYIFTYYKYRKLQAIFRQSQAGVSRSQLMNPRRETGATKRMLSILTGKNGPDLPKPL